MATELRTFDDLLSDCVHCGFCLPACPTYRSWGNEMDSPRGRIDLMLGVRQGKIDLDDAVVEHFDRCLGCMACVTACPSGVRYDMLIEETRVQVEDERTRAPQDQAFRDLIFALFPRPDRLKALAPLLYFFRKTGLQKLVRDSGVLGFLSRRVEQLDTLMPPLEFSQLLARLPSFTPARGRRRGTVALIAGCVQRVFFPNVNASTARVLAAEGYDVVVPPGQGCWIVSFRQRAATGLPSSMPSSSTPPAVARRSSSTARSSPATPNTAAAPRRSRQRYET
jgi:glycolate oxidase iron-sulfur subunit